MLDNLIHGYFILDHPERLDYDYEHIYALVAYRAAKASGNVTFKPGASGQWARHRLSLPGARTSEKKSRPLPLAPAKDDDEAKPSPKSDACRRAPPRMKPPNRPADSRACRPSSDDEDKQDSP